MDTYVVLALFSYATTSAIFDLWMNQIGFNTFALVVNFIDDAWVLKHVNVDIFKTPNIAGATLVEIIKPLLAKFKFTHTIITYVKDEGSNLNTLTVIAYIIVSCESLQLETPFVGVCFGHVMSKAY
jgi:hypothetical protein